METREAWNKGKKPGQKKGFTLEQVQVIASTLKIEGDIMEQALFHTAIDSMLRSCDLLPLTVADITTQNGTVKDVFTRTQKKLQEKTPQRMLPLPFFLLPDTY